jgi:hypothetical protein
MQYSNVKKKLRLPPLNEGSSLSFSFGLSLENSSKNLFLFVMYSSFFLISSDIIILTIAQACLRNGTSMSTLGRVKPWSKYSLEKSNGLTHAHK